MNSEAGLVLLSKVGVIFTKILGKLAHGRQSKSPMLESDKGGVSERWRRKKKSRRIRKNEKKY